MLTIVQEPQKQCWNRKAENSSWIYQLWTSKYQGQSCHAECWNWFCWEDLLIQLSISVLRRKSCLCHPSWRTCTLRKTHTTVLLHSFTVPFLLIGAQSCWINTAAAKTIFVFVKHCSNCHYHMGLPFPIPQASRKYFRSRHCFSKIELFPLICRSL